MIARYTAPGGGIELDTGDGVHVVKAGATDTGGEYEVFEVALPAGPVVPAHRTPWPKTIYVLGGEVVAHVEQERHRLTPGAALTIPAGAAHTVEVVPPAARVLAISPGARAGGMFADLAAAVTPGTPLEQAVPALLEVAARHGVTFPVAADQAWT